MRYFVHLVVSFFFVGCEGRAESWGAVAPSVAPSVPPIVLWGLRFAVGISGCSLIFVDDFGGGEVGGVWGLGCELVSGMVEVGLYIRSTAARSM